MPVRLLLCGRASPSPAAASVQLAPPYIPGCSTSHLQIPETCGCAKPSANSPCSVGWRRLRPSRNSSRQKSGAHSELSRLWGVIQPYSGLLFCLEEASNTLQPLLRRGNFGDAQTEVPIDQNHFAARHDLVADDQVNGICDVTVQLHNVAGAKVENLAQRHLAASEAKGCLKLYIQQQFQARTQRR